MKAEAGQKYTPRRELFSCGVGGFYNDLISKVTLSFGLVFYSKVANLSSKQTGLLLVVGQAVLFASNFLFGYSCDHVDIPLVARLYGRRKSWHLVGTIFSVSFFVFAFSRCLLCSEPVTHSWFGFGYFTIAYGMVCLSWVSVNVAHLSLIPETAKTQDEVIIVNSIRVAFSYLGGICTYGVAWIFLGRSSDAHFSPANSTDFTKITGIMSAIGLLFVLIFHVGSSETKQKNEKPRRKSTTIHAPGVYSVPVALYDLEQECENVPEGGNVERKKSAVTSVLRKASTYIAPFGAEMSQAGAGSRKISTNFRQRESTMCNLEILQEEERQGEIQKANRVRKKVVHKRPRDLENLNAFPNGLNLEDIDELQAIQTVSTIRESTKPDKRNDLFEMSKEASPEENHNPRNSPKEIAETIHVSRLGTEDRKFVVKSAKKWLKDPQLYKATAIFTSAYNLENLMFSYLSLYLIDHLHFEKEATAYFLIVFLVSGVFGCVIFEKIRKMIGREWTFCGVAVLAMGTATWLYFITESTKQTVYAPIVLLGCCVSSMIVMSLSYLGDVVAENKESAGFVFSFATATQKATTGALLLLIQSFYPSSSADCQDCGNYVRVVYPLILGFLPFTGLLVVLFSEFLTYSDKQTGQEFEATVITNPGAVRNASPSPDETEVTEWNTRL